MGVRLMKAQRSAFSLGSVLAVLSIDESIYNRENAGLSLAIFGPLSVKSSFCHSVAVLNIPVTFSLYVLLTMQIAINTIYKKNNKT